MSDILGYLNRGMNWLSDTFSELNGSVKNQTKLALAEQAQSLYEEGERACQQQDYATATRRYEECLAIYRRIESMEGMAAMHYALGDIARQQYDYRTARAHAEKSWALASSCGNPTLRFISIVLLANTACTQGDETYSLRLYDECLHLSKNKGEKTWIGTALLNRAVVYSKLGNYDLARKDLEESLALFQELNLKRDIALALNNLGALIVPNSDYTAQRAFLQESLRLNRELGCVRGNAHVVHNLGTIERYEGDYESALSKYRLSLTIHRECGNKPDIANVLEECAAVAVARQQGVRAARLFGAAAALRETMGAPLPSDALEEYEENILAACSLAGEEAFMTACAVGRAMPMELAIEYALHDEKD